MMARLGKSLRLRGNRAQKIGYPKRERIGRPQRPSTQVGESRNSCSGVMNLGIRLGNGSASWSSEIPLIVNEASLETDRP